MSAEIRAMHDALVHIEGALKALTLEAYRSGPDGEWTPADHFTVAEELKRVDCAIGPKGESMFARLADSIVDAYTELLAARQAVAASQAREADAYERAAKVNAELAECRVTRDSALDVSEKLEAKLASIRWQAKKETIEQCITAARNCYLRLPKEEVIVGDILDDRIQTAIRALAGKEG